MTALATPQRGLAGPLAAAATLVAGAAMFLVVAAMIGGKPATATSTTVFGVSQLALDDIPPKFLGLYQQAARKEGIDWAVLAGIGRVETNHKRLNAPGVTEGANAYGCCGGPMQFYFVPFAGRLAANETNSSTWGHYGVDGNGDGYKDVWDEQDAILAAAAYLKASGAPGDYKAAVWAYNHSDAYYRDVMGWADKYRGDLQTVVGEQIVAVALPTGDRLGQLVAAMNQLEAARLPYCYGGGHDFSPAKPSGGSYCWGGTPLRQIVGSGDKGLDCSSSVSWVLQRIGYSLPTLTSVGFASWGQAGPGKWVTIWTNPAHVYLEIRVNGQSRYWGTSTENYRHGPGWHSPRSGAGFVSRHPVGL